MPDAIDLIGLDGGDEELKIALEYFLLYEPQKQIPVLNPDSLAADAQRAQEHGNPLMARVDYEIAAKVELYNQHKDKVKQYILAADSLTENEGYREMHAALLSKLDRALESAKNYYAELQAREDSGKPSSPT